MTLAELEREIAALLDHDRAALTERWRKLYRRDPPKGISRPLLIRAIAYEMQTQIYGGLKAATERRLSLIAHGKEETDRGNGNTSAKLRTGARLVREWNGATHTVDVVEGGYLWSGNHYRSLSAIARAITGAHWSGPRFFGLTSRGAS
jgi:hypothetical protein